MSVRRVLVGCTVLSLQDACVFYPCCKSCFSRLDAEQRDATWYRCSRCGYRCVKDQVDYRYRLSLLVTRDTYTLGVTVFGNSLNSLFGVHASGLQRLVENVDGPLGPSTSSTLLVKAVEDCFLGRYFIFGIKVRGTEWEPWLEDCDGNGSSRRDRAQFVATQMILPTASGLTGCTVVGYYQRLLQKASEYVAESHFADLSKTSRSFTVPLLLISDPSPNSTVSDAPLYPSGLLSQSLFRPQHQDHTFPLTPPWQQSLELVTSSAEQEERSSQDGGDESSSLTEQGGTPDSAQRVYPPDHPDTEDRTVPLQLERSFHSDLSFTGHSNSSFPEGVGNGFNVKACLSSSQPRYKSCSLTQKELPATHQTETLSSTSFAWDDLPFSESLAEFLDKDLNALNETPSLNLRHPKRTAGTEETISKDKLQDITNATIPEGGGGITLPDKDCGEKQEKHNAVDSYNCSADLFGDSLVHTETHIDHAQTMRFPSDASYQLPERKDQHLKNETARMSPSTPQKRTLKSNPCLKRDSIELIGFDFVPPSQSTPVMKISALTHSPGINPCRHVKSSKENVIQETRSSKYKNKIPPGSRFRKPDKSTDRHPVGQHATLQRRTFSCDSPTTNSQKDDFEESDVTVCDYEDDEGVVGPTPAHKKQLSVTLSKKWQMDDSHKGSGCKRKESRGDEENCSRILWNRTRTVFYANETVGEICLDGTREDLAEDGDQTCDWSKDLFSDSI